MVEIAKYKAVVEFGIKKNNHLNHKSQTNDILRLEANEPSKIHRQISQYHVMCELEFGYETVSLAIKSCAQNAVRMFDNTVNICSHVGAEDVYYVQGKFG